MVLCVSSYKNTSVTGTSLESYSNCFTLFAIVDAGQQILLRCYYKSAIELPWNVFTSGNFGPREPVFLIVEIKSIKKNLGV